MFAKSAVESSLFNSFYNSPSLFTYHINQKSRPFSPLDLCDTLSLSPTFSVTSHSLSRSYFLTFSFLLLLSLFLLFASLLVFLCHSFSPFLSLLPSTLYLLHISLPIIYYLLFSLFFCPPLSLSLPFLCRLFLFESATQSFDAVLQILQPNIKHLSQQVFPFLDKRDVRCHKTFFVVSIVP